MKDEIPKLEDFKVDRVVGEDEIGVIDLEKEHVEYVLDGRRSVEKMMDELCLRKEVNGVVVWTQEIMAISPLGQPLHQPSLVEHIATDVLRTWANRELIQKKRGSQDVWFALRELLGEGESLSNVLKGARLEGGGVAYLIGKRMQEILRG